MIIPSIDLVNGKAVQMVAGKAVGGDAKDPTPLVDKYSITGNVTLIDMDAALGKGDNAALIRELVQKYPCRVGGGIRTVEEAIAWLDAGADKVIIGSAASKSLLAELPRDRVVAAIDVRDGEVLVNGCGESTGQSALERIAALKDVAGEILVIQVEREGSEGGIDMDFVKQVKEAAGKGVAVTVGGGISTPEEIAAIDKLGIDAQVGMALHTGKLSLADGLIAPIKTDRPDGLWATLVCDDMGQCLGLVYSDLESVREAVKRKKGAYHSRSRGLWVKGLTSGNMQELVEIKLDCDRDAMRFIVKQGGEGFCHNHTWTCFGEDAGIGRLFRTLESRKESAPEGSYTKRLFDDPALLKAKIVEEAGELAAASDRASVIEEAADVVYFAAAALVSAGADISDLEQALHLRSKRITRRGGDPK